MFLSAFWKRWHPMKTQFRRAPRSLVSETTPWCSIGLAPLRRLKPPSLSFHLRTHCALMD